MYSKLETIKVRDVMTRGVITVPITATVREICKIIAENKISAVVVVLPDGEMIGVISETDLILKIDSVKNIDEATAENIMQTSNIKTIDPDASVADALRIMKENLIHRLIVAHEIVKRPVGIITATDIIRLIAKS
ncbi:MAG: cyclic nucleotide-binding/CBS domain-containing protein [Candidatus Altarchaeaceae archaeon]